MRVATVIVPTHNHATTLATAVESALAQTVADLEVIVIGDGVDDATREVAHSIARADSRVAFVDRAKGPRHGERYRHEALATAGGRIVCYLSDDDLWLCDHVEHMDELLQHADFTHAVPLLVEADGELRALGVELEDAQWRERLSAVENRVPLSCAGHTMDAYRRLPFGWRPAPREVFTDWYMWQQFLAQRDLRFTSGWFPTVVHFPSPWRSGKTPDERGVEIRTWAERLTRENGRAEFLDDVARRLWRERSGWEIYGLGLEERVGILEQHAASLETANAERAQEISRLAGAAATVALAHERLQEMHDLAADRFDRIERQQGELDALASQHEALRTSLLELQADKQRLERELAAIRATKTWRVHDRVTESALVGRAASAIRGRRTRA